MGVWQQLKSAPEPSVFTQGIFGIVTGLKTDLYYQASQTVLTVIADDYSKFKSSIANKIIHLPDQTLQNLYYDENYGLKTYFS